MSYLGDYDPGSVIDLKFTTVDNTGLPTALSSGAIQIYKGNSTTPSTAGLTLTSTFASVTGMNHLRIQTTADSTFYASANEFQAIVSAGTANSVSIIGYVAGEFSLQNRSFLRPSSTGQTLAVQSNGSVLISSGTGAGQVNLAGGVANANAMQFAGQTITATAGVTIPALIASSTNITAGTVTTVTNLTNAPSTGDFTATMKASLNAATPASIVGAVGSVTGDIGGNVDGNVLGTIGSLAAQAQADVKTQVVAAFNTDTYAEPGQEAPGATITLVKKIGYLYKAFRNKSTQSATTLSIYNDNGTTVDQKSTVSDDGTTYTRGKLGTGP